MRKMFLIILLTFTGCAASYESRLAIVSCDDRNGSGFPVGRHLILTANHLINCGLPLVDGEPAEIVVADFTRDLALLKVKAKYDKVCFEDAEVTDEVYLYSNAWNSGGLYTKHVVAGFAMIEGVEHLAVFPSILTGSSGGAIVTRGCVVGLAVSANVALEGGFGFAVTAKEIRKFLKEMP